jgi:hypothetical protein
MRELFIIVDDAGKTLTSLGQGLWETQHLVREFSSEQGLGDLVNELEVQAPAGGFQRTTSSPTAPRGRWYSAVMCSLVPASMHTPTSTRDLQTDHA